MQQQTAVTLRQAQVAPPRLMTKPQCFSLICAPPTCRPRSPQSSMSLPAKAPCGRLKVLPALGHSSGCLSRRRCKKSCICAVMASLSPAASRTRAETMHHAGCCSNTLVR